MSDSKSAVADLLRRLPDAPGVYRFFDAAGAIIYIGKAKSLKNRVKSYFQQSADLSPKTVALVKEIADLKWIETNSEVEALALEANLVKEHQPKFNVLLRDDKHFLYFKLTTNAAYPRVELVRRIEKDGARYFGPKIDADAARETVRFLERLFHARVCGAHPEADHARVAERRQTLELPCPFFKMAMCPGPALDHADAQAAYADYVRQVASFLAGNTREVITELSATMQAAATAKQFEYAARLRDQLVAIQKTTEKQFVSDPSLASRDIVGVCVDGARAYIALLEVRDGKLIDQKNFTLRVADDDMPTALEGFLTQYYRLATDLPREIVLPDELPNASVVGEWLSELAERKVELLVPERGKKSGLLRLAEKNAAAYRVQSKAKFENASERTIGAARELATALGIEKVLKRIECYDISHLSGTATTASMVVFENGEPKTADYRHFNIRSLATGEIDDFRSLAEILRRRMSYLTPQLPDGVKIRRATKKDLVIIREQLISEERATFEIETLASTPLFVAVNAAGGLIGRVRECVFGERDIHAVKNVWIDPAWRGQRLGHVLIRKLLEASKAKKIYLDCNPSLESYYAELGFRATYEPIPELIAVVQASCVASGQVVTTDELTSRLVCMVYEKKTKVDSSFGATPDLVILDGGKGQLSTVLDGVKFPKKTTVVSLAKQFEEIWRLKEIAPSSPTLPKEYAFRRGTKKDIPRLKEILTEARLDTSFAPSDVSYLVCRGDDLVGCYRFVRHDPTCLEFASLWVHPDERHHGIGTFLIHDALVRAKQQLHLIAIDPPLYERSGFRVLTQPPEILTAKVAKLNEQFPKTADRRVVMVHDQNSQNKVSSSFECIRLPENSNALHLVTRLRDEAHRFANDLRKKVLAKTDFASALDELDGVGAETRAKLLKKFGSAEGVRQASEHALIDLLGETNGRAIYARIHN